MVCGRSMNGVVLLLLFFLLALVAAAAGAVSSAGGLTVLFPPPLATPAVRMSSSGRRRVGIQLHWGYNPLQPGLIRNLSKGFDVARIDFLWTMVEQQRGNYSFAQYEELAALLHQHNITAAWNLDYGNPLYQNGTGPPYNVAVTTPEAIDGFTKFAVASIRHFRGQGIIWGVSTAPLILSHAAQILHRAVSELYCELALPWLNSHYCVGFAASCTTNPTVTGTA